MFLSQVVADVADASLGDNKPNFPTPDVNPSNNQDVFKQLGDKVSLALLLSALCLTADAARHLLMLCLPSVLVTHSVTEGANLLVHV